jgi:hypothetical protein
LTHLNQLESVMSMCPREKLTSFDEDYQNLIESVTDSGVIPHRLDESVESVMSMYEITKKINSKNCFHQNFCGLKNAQKSQILLYLRN